MHVKVPEVNRCCFCFPLRYGIMVFGIINVILSVIAVACLVVTTELKKAALAHTSVDEVTSTVLYSILGMGVLLNVVLLLGGCQKDISMLRLYNYYALLMTLVALVPLFILLYRHQFEEVGAALVSIVMQIYVIILVRSEIVKLETMMTKPDETPRDIEDSEISPPDTNTLL